LLEDIDALNETLAGEEEFDIFYYMGLSLWKSGPISAMWTGSGSLGKVPFPLP
jgi:hypothetical protein